LPIGLITAAVMLMTSMSMVHEHVHQRARRQEQPGQIRDEMRAMLGDDEETADDREQDEYLFDTSAYYVLMRLALLVHGCFLVARKMVDRISSRGANSPICGATK
jgi:hypothetical protein